MRLYSDSKESGLRDQREGIPSRTKAQHLAERRARNVLEVMVTG